MKTGLMRLHKLLRLRITAGFFSNCINLDHCTECQCLSTEYVDGIPNGLVENNVCNDETNTIECGFDGFDCCKGSITNGHCHSKFSLFV